MKKAIQFAKESIEISDYNFWLINQVQKHYYLIKTHLQSKQKATRDFDGMVCSDGSEKRELVGTYIVNQLKDNLQHYLIGLNRDDCLVGIKGLSGPEI